MVDSQGFPREFRCTEPIRPGTVQSLLYGSSLRKFVLVKLIGENLWEQTQSHPAGVLVDDEEIAEIGNAVGIPVAVVRSGHAEEQLVVAGDVTENPEKFVLTSPRGDEKTYWLSSLGTEAASFRDLLNQRAQRMDVAEPLSRVQAVLEALERQHANSGRAR